MSKAFDYLLEEVRALHLEHPAVRDFCAMPDDLTPQAITPTHQPAADLMAVDTGLYSQPHAGLRDAFLAAGVGAQWRESYDRNVIGGAFMDRFGVYCLIGSGGPWASAQMACYMVYMPAKLWYTWHHHPAEEMYVIIAGEAEFSRKGHAPETLRPGDTVFHASNQPHATETHDHPVMAYVMWRNNLGIRPTLTPPEMM